MYTKLTSAYYKIRNKMENSWLRMYIAKIIMVVITEVLFYVHAYTYCIYKSDAFQ